MEKNILEYLEVAAVKPLAITSKSASTRQKNSTTKPLMHHPAERETERDRYSETERLRGRQKNNTTSSWRSKREKESSTSYAR